MHHNGSGCVRQLVVRARAKSGLTGSTGTDTESLARLDKNFVKACSFWFTTVSSQVTATRSEDCLRTKLAMSCWKRVLE